MEKTSPNAGTDSPVSMPLAAHPATWRDYEVALKPADLADLAFKAARKKCSQTQYLRLLIRKAMTHAADESRLPKARRGED